MSDYLIRLLGNDKKERAASRDVVSPSFEHQPSVASPFKVELPATQEILDAGDLTNLVNIVKNNQDLYTGVITSRNIGHRVTLEGFTREYLYSNAVCPLDYGSKLSGLPLGDGVRHIILGGWDELTYKLQEDWDSTSTQFINTESSTADNGLIQLKKEANKHYPASGSVRVIFDSHDVVDFKHWQTVRWLSTFADDVATGIQVQFVETLAGITESEYLPSTTTDYGAESQVLGAAGFLTDSAGLDVGKRTERFAVVRFNLATNDTTTPNSEDAPTAFGVTPTVQFVQMLCRTHEYNWLTEMPDGFPSTDEHTIGNISLSNINGLEMLGRIFENVNTRHGTRWQFMAKGDTLHIGNPLGRNLTDSVLLNTGRR